MTAASSRFGDVYPSGARQPHAAALPGALVAWESRATKFFFRFGRRNLA